MTWEIQIGRNQISRLRDVGGLESWTGCLKPDAMKRLLACSDIMIEFRSSNLMKGMRVDFLMTPVDCIMKSLKKYEYKAGQVLETKLNMKRSFG